MPPCMSGTRGAQFFSAGATRLQVQLLLGQLPSPTLVAAHGLHQYGPIIAAMRSGNVKLFNDTMDAQQFRFIQEVRGTGNPRRISTGAGHPSLHHLVVHILFARAAQGTYLLLEKLRYATYRRLLRKVHAVHAEVEPDKRTQVPLVQFQNALAMQVCGAGWKPARCRQTNRQVPAKRACRAYVWTWMRPSVSLPT